MSDKEHTRSRPCLWIFAFIALFLFGCESEANRFKRYDVAIGRAEEEYVLATVDPQVALARIESAIIDAEQHFKDGFKHKTLVHLRVYLNFRKMKEASLRNDLDEVERLAKITEELAADENYPLDLPYGANGLIDRKGVIQFITEWDRKSQIAVKEYRAAHPTEK